MSSNVENLVNESKKGNVAAFGDLYEMYSADMFRFAYYYTGSKTVAEDCVSEAVLIAFRRIGELKNISAFKSWLFRILRNCCAASFRKASREISVEETEQDVHSFDTDSDDKISLREALLCLSIEEREILILYYCNGYTSKEISLMLSLNENTVRSKLSRSTEKLRKELS